MSQAEQIRFWAERANAAGKSLAASRDQRRRPQRSGMFEEETRARFARLSVPAVAPKAHEVLQGASLSGERDEERFRRLEVFRGGGSSTADHAPCASAPRESNLSGASFGALGRARQLAAGYQPAVVKVISYAHGAARATATANYVLREDVALETHDGRSLADAEAVAQEIKQWSKTFETRKESQDVVAIRLQLYGVRDTPESRELYHQAIKAGFDGHRHAHCIEPLPGGQMEARLVVAMAGGPKERFRVRDERIGTVEDGFDQKRLDAKSEAAIKARIEAATNYPQHVMSVEPGVTAHGRDGVIWQLGRHVEKHGALQADNGVEINSATDVRNLARDWGRALRSQSPRDTMHLMISAKAVTDPEALKNAARSFLQDIFADHKFMFGIHTDKQAQGHIHAHAVITVKNEMGQKIHPGRDDFRAWREAYAEHARAQGLKIVATSAIERASSQSYGAKDKAIVGVAERPRPAREARDRAYASDPINQRLISNARQRMADAAANPLKLPLTEYDRRIVNEGVAAWSAVATEAPQNETAKTMFERLSLAQAIGSIAHAIGKRVQHLTQPEDKPMAITALQMEKDLAIMNETVSRTSDLLDGPTKQQFREASGRYLETLANRVDLQRVRESGVEQLSRAELQEIVGVNADRLIQRAQEVRDKEQGEASAAQNATDRAIEAERRKEASGGTGPQALKAIPPERAAVSASQQSAAREAREATAAIEAARIVAEHPAQPIPASLVQTDALAKVRSEQDKMIDQLEVERLKGEAMRGQRIRGSH